MAYDFKKEFRELYKPSGKPSVVTRSAYELRRVRGKGNPNAEGGEYQNALPLLYGVAYTIKMSKKGPRRDRRLFRLRRASARGLLVARPHRWRD